MRSAIISTIICIVLLGTASLALAAEDSCTSCHKQAMTALAESSHPVISCADCHLGNPSAKSMKEAHIGITVEAAALDIMDQTCGKCHAETVETYRTSLHATVEGLKHGAIEMLGEDRGTFVGENRCGTCHATCADCHFELEADGTLAAHSFTSEPATKNCKACHDQTGTGYVGFEGTFEPSVHAAAGMDCIDCHGGQEVHGTGTIEKRLADVVEVRCVDCHSQSQEIASHKIHENTLECSACHVDWYYNCYGCHGYDENTNELGYEKFNTNHYLARRSDNGKVASVVHIPMSEAVGGPDYVNGAWVVKDRHSTQKNAKECQDCHLNAQTFVMDQYREAPFLGAVDAEFLPKDQVMNEVLVFKTHGKIMGKSLKPGQTPDSECLKCHN